MAESNPRIPRLVEPPRDIPLGLRFKLLTPYDVTGTMLYTVPAAALLVIAAMGPLAKAPRIGMVVVASILLLLTLQSALPALARATATLRRMRNGFLTVGRIVSCHLAWDKKRSEMPYSEFLEDWTVKVARSQMGKAIGCFTTIFLWIILAPVVLFMIGAGIAAGIAWLHAPDAAAIAAGQLTVADGVKFILMGIAFIICVVVFVRLARRSAVDEVEPYMQWRKLTARGPDGIYDDHAKELVAAAKMGGWDPSLKASLPEDSSSSVNLICKVEYSVMNTPQVATGRARLCRRLDPSGVELLIFDPARRGEVDLLVGLPAEVQIDSQGQWKDVPNAGVLAAITGTVSAIALIALGVNVQRLLVAG